MNFSSLRKSRNFCCVWKVKPLSNTGHQDLLPLLFLGHWPRRWLTGSGSTSGYQSRHANSSTLSLFCYSGIFVLQGDHRPSRGEWIPTLIIPIMDWYAALKTTPNLTSTLWGWRTNEQNELFPAASNEKRRCSKIN